VGIARGEAVTELLIAQQLSRENFAAFGDVIETEHAHHYTINTGWATRYHDLATLDLGQHGGQPCISIFRALARPAPVKLQIMERHQFGSQTFVPLSTTPFLVAVAQQGAAPTSPNDLFIFITNGRQGVNYKPGVWHHPLLAIETTSDFLIVDRNADTDDCDEVDIADWRLNVLW
jgi:ureidoglycolate lyase